MVPFLCVCLWELNSPSLVSAATLHPLLQGSYRNEPLWHWVQLSWLRKLQQQTQVLLRSVLSGSCMAVKDTMGNPQADTTEVDPSPCISIYTIWVCVFTHCSLPWIFRQPSPPLLAEGHHCKSWLLQLWLNSEQAKAACVPPEQRAPPGISQGWLLGCDIPALRGKSLSPLTAPLPASTLTKGVGEHPLNDWCDHERPEVVIRPNWGKKTPTNPMQICEKSWLKWKRLVEVFEWNEERYTPSAPSFSLWFQAWFCLTENSVLSLIFRLFILLGACEVIFMKRKPGFAKQFKELNFGKHQNMNCEIFSE